jgi:hypothetical protein
MSFDQQMAQQIIYVFFDIQFHPLINDLEQQQILEQSNILKQTIFIICLVNYIPTVIYKQGLIFISE